MFQRVSFLQFFFVILLTVKSFVSAEYKIINANDFVTFIDSVNSGKTYLNSTVYLESDLSLSTIASPIGKDSNYFLGTFDGQGHVISDLSVTSSSSSSSSSSLHNVGLFGYSKGLTIRNVILDDSCSIIKSDNLSYISSVGGFIGSCDGQCIIRNSVNMASVTFNGNIDTSYQLYLGGIAGYIRLSSISTSLNAYVKNCANYGPVTHSGTTGSSYIGGVIGFCEGSGGNHIQNCLNHGMITHSGTTSNAYYLFIGSVIGYTKFVTIENSVSAGHISVASPQVTSNNVGSIIGYAYGYQVAIAHCLWTNDVGYNISYGSGGPSVANSSQVVLSSEIVSELNSYSTNNSWNEWLLNVENVSATVNFKINDGRTFGTKSGIVLLPNLADNSKRTFDGWYTDKYMTVKFVENEVFSDTLLYGSFSCPEIVVTLDVNGGDELSSGGDNSSTMHIGCDRVYGDLPTPTRTEATFNGWFTESVGGYKIVSGDSLVILSNHTLYAQWTVNKYTLTFIFGNCENDRVSTVEYNREITYPDDPVKEGYTFSGWDSNITAMPAYNLTIRAQWSANVYIVTFDVNGGSKLGDCKITVVFGYPYGNLPSPNRSRYGFVGWVNEMGLNVTSETIVDIPRDHVLIAQWEEKNGSSKSNSDMVLIVIIIVVVIVLIVVVCCVFSKRKKRDVDEKRKSLLGEL